MPLSEKEEFELLSLEREKAMASRPAPAKPVEAPQEPPQSLASKFGNAALQGLRTGGPMGAIMGLATPGIEAGNELISKGAYNAGGAVSDLTGSPALGVAANVGIQAIPTLAGGAIGSKVGELGKAGGERLMRMALKPSPTIGPEKQASAVKTMLTADVGNIFPGANVSPGGIEKLQKKREALAKAVGEILDNSPATVNKYNVAKGLKDTEATFANQVNPTADLEAINRVKAEFLRTRPTNMPVKEAHDLKQGTYKVLGDKAYKGELKTADVSAQKALARALRKETEAGAPGIAPLNAEQSDIINAVKAAISREAVAGGKDPVGLGFLSGNPEYAAAYLANRSEFLKSILARLLYSGGKPVATGMGAAAGAAYANQEGNQ